MDIPKVVGFLDIGTNSVRLLVISISKDRSWKILARHKATVRLGEKEFTQHHIIPEAIERGIAAITRFAQIARNFSVEEIVAVATSASREADNRDEFINQVYNLTGVQVQVISGEEEARLIWLGVSRGIRIGMERALFIDIGGGSTEIIVGDQFNPFFLTSLRLGAIRLTSTYLNESPQKKISSKSLAEIRSHIDKEVLETADLLKKTPYSSAYGSSGTIIALESIAREHPSLAHCHEPEILTTYEIDFIINYLCSLTLEKRRKVPGLNPDRADIIIAGALVLQKILTLSGLSRIFISRHGLRDGLMEDYLQKNYSQQVPGQAGRDQSVREFGKTFHIDENHACHVMMLSMQLFESSKTCMLHSLPESAKELLKHAAYLHDIGHIISYNRHHHHSDYLITHASIPGFDHDELRVMGLITRYHRKKPPRSKDVPFIHLRKEEQKMIQILAQFLRIAEKLDTSHDMRVSSVRFVKTSARRIYLEVHAIHDCCVEWDAIQADADIFEKTFNIPLILTRINDLEDPEGLKSEPYSPLQISGIRQDCLTCGMRG